MLVNLALGKAEAGGSCILGQCELHDKGLSEGGKAEWDSQSRFFFIPTQVYLVVLRHKALET